MTDRLTQSLTAMLDIVYPIEPKQTSCFTCGDSECRKVQALTCDLKTAGCEKWRPE